MTKYFLLVALLMILFLSTGWVYRNLIIDSKPQGAVIYFNDKKIGETPYTFDFMWYARHRIRLEKEGYLTFEKVELIKAPFFMWFPIDLVSEVIPIPLKDQRNLFYKLSQKENFKKE